MIIPLVQLAHAVLFWFQDFVPTAEFFVYPFLTARGLLPYSEIIDHHFPGLFFFPVNFFTLGITTPQDFKVLALLVILLTSTALYHLAKLYTSNKSIQTEIIILYALWQTFFSGSVLWIDLFVSLFVVVGFYNFRRNRHLLAGFLFSLALIFKQTAILPLAFLSLFLLNKPRQMLLLIVPTIISLTATYWYFNQLGVGSDFVYWNFTFNFMGYAREAAMGPGLSDLIKLSLPLGLFLSSAWLVIHNHDSKLLQLCGLIIVLSLTAFSRFGLEHFQPLVPFFCLLVPLTLPDIKLIRSGAMVVSVIWLGFFMLRHPPSMQLKNFSRSDIDTYSAVGRLVPPARSVALLGATPLILSQNRLLPVGKLYYFPLPWFFSRLEDRQLAVWQTSPPDLIIYNPESRVDGQYISSSAPALVEYMQMHYRKEAVIGENEIYTRK